MYTNSIKYCMFLSLGGLFLTRTVPPVRFMTVTKFGENNILFSPEKTARTMKVTERQRQVTRDGASQQVIAILQHSTQGSDPADDPAFRTGTAVLSAQ